MNWIQSTIFKYWKKTVFNTHWSHPIGLNGQNHIIAVTPMKFLPFTEYERRQKSIDSNSKLALMSSMMKIKTDVIAKKKMAKAGFQIAVKSNMTHFTWLILLKLAENLIQGVEGNRERCISEDETRGSWEMLLRSDRIEYGIEDSLDKSSQMPKCYEKVRRNHLGLWFSTLD